MEDSNHLLIKKAEKPETKNDRPSLDGLKERFTLEDIAGSTGLIHYRAVWYGCECCRGLNVNAILSVDDIINYEYTQSEDMGTAGVKVIMTPYEVGNGGVA